jgi:hypothetical protein
MTKLYPVHLSNPESDLAPGSILKPARKRALRNPYLTEWWLMMRGDDTTFPSSEVVRSITWKFLLELRGSASVRDYEIRHRIFLCYLRAARSWHGRKWHMHIPLEPTIPKMQGASAVIPKDSISHWISTTRVVLISALLDTTLSITRTWTPLREPRFFASIPARSYFVFDTADQWRDFL